MELYVSAQKVMDRAEYEERLQARYNDYPGSDPAGTEYDYRQRDKAIASIDRAIRKEGYDGVWDRESGEMFVFDPEQSKAPRTTWAPSMQATRISAIPSLMNPRTHRSCSRRTSACAGCTRRLPARWGDVSRYKGKITQEAALTAARGNQARYAEQDRRGRAGGQSYRAARRGQPAGRSGPADNEFLVQLAQNIARQVLEQSTFVDENARTLDQALRRHLRGTRISLSDAQKGRGAQGAGRYARLRAGQHGALCGSERRHSAFSCGMN